jgi:hypothetical protein
MGETMTQAEALKEADHAFGSVVPTEAGGKLKKRPAAFRVEIIPGNGAFEYFDYEDDARECADAASVEYEALYVRDGTPLNFDDASPPSPISREIVEAMRTALHAAERAHEIHANCDDCMETASDPVSCEHCVTSWNEAYELRQSALSKMEGKANV